MFTNNLKIAIRSLLRSKLFSSLNILGLGFGIACFLLISLYVLDEMTFDRFHSNFNNIYRVLLKQDQPDTGSQTFGAVGYAVSDAARNELPGVKNATKLLSWGRAVFRNKENQKAFYQEFLTAENSIFEIFDFSLEKGDASNALKEPATVVISKDFASKLFGNADPIGKLIETDRDIDLIVTGILDDIPGNSHMQFDALVSHQTITTQLWFGDDVSGDWSSQNWFTYLLLDEHTNPVSVGTKLTALAEMRGLEERPFSGLLELQPFREIHFGSANILRERQENKSSKSYIYIFGFIGLFILGIACINYINLATARSIHYQREVGVRKVVGAGMQHLFTRFMSESLLVTIIAFIVGVGLAQAFLPVFNGFTNKALELNFIDNNWLLPVLVLMVLLVGFLAGAYPSAYLSRFKPIAVLSSSSHAVTGGNGQLRKGLVVLQFSLSIILIIGTLIAWKQLDFVQHKDLGFEDDQLIVVDINSGKVRNGFETIRSNYDQLPTVESVSVSSRVPGEWKDILQTEIRLPNSSEEDGVKPWFIGCDEYFLKTFGLNLISGRNFEIERSADSASVIINRKAAQILGIDEASEQEILIVSRINNGSERVLQEPFRARVIGICEDFNYKSLYEPIEPLVLGYRKNPIQSIDYFTAKISGLEVDRTIAQMTEILNAVDPEHVFEYHFLDDQIEHFYQEDKQRSRLLTSAALCAIFIACLGLFGLASFTAEQRTKEIGIRKVLGANSLNILGLLSKDFLMLVAISILIASPIAWYYMEKWLTNFAFRIDIGWPYFLFAGLIALAIAFLTVSFQSLKAAFANPINSLRNE